MGPGLIIKEKKGDEIIIKPVLIQPNVIELSYYGNCLLPYFAMQSIVGKQHIDINKINKFSSLYSFYKFSFFQ